MDNNYEHRWKRQRTDDDEYVSNGDQDNPETKRMRTKSINLAYGYDDDTRRSEHVRFLSILMRLFPEQKRNVLELILKGCGGDIVQTIECVLPSHEEARARGHFFPPGLPALYQAQSTGALSNGMSAFSPYAHAARQAIPMSPTECHPPQSCSGVKCPSCVYYPGIGHVHLTPNQMRELSTGELPNRRPSRGSPEARPPSAEQKVSLTQERKVVLEDMRDSQRVRSATAALVSMSSVPMKRHSVIKDYHSTSSENSPRRSSADESNSPSH